MFKCLSLKTAGHKSHLVTGEHSQSITCLRQVLMDVVIIKEDAVKLFITAALQVSAVRVTSQALIEYFCCHMTGLLKRRAQ